MKAIYGVSRHGETLLPFMPFADLADSDLQAGVRHGFDPRSGAELREDLADVELRGVLGDLQLARRQGPRMRARICCAFATAIRAPCLLCARPPEKCDKRCTVPASAVATSDTVRR